MNTTSAPGSHRRTPTWLALLLTILLGAGAAFAQLSREDLIALQSHGQQEGWTFTVGENSATPYPLEQLCGVVVPANWREGARFDNSPPRGGLPPSFDWRTQGACTPIKHQGGCGSCWAFALHGAFESAIVLADNEVVDLSEQWLVSCLDLGGCGGEWPGNAADYCLCTGQYTDQCGDFGAVLEEEFPYVAWEAPCGCPYTHPYCLEDWAFIGPEWGIPTVAQLKQAIVDHGPITVCVYANDAFHGYTGGVFNVCEDTNINHAVVLVGWDDSQGANGVWFLRNSWGSGWGEDGYMRIEYNCSRVGYNGLYLVYAGAQPGLTFSYPDGRPQWLAPERPTTFRVQVAGEHDGVPVPDSGQLHYSQNGAAYVTVPMASLGAGLYEATLPAADCFTEFSWYVSAAEATVGRLYDPSQAPADAYRALVATGQTVFFDDTFETDQGWTVVAGADTGNWEWADPEVTSNNGQVVQPEDDHTPAGTLCYVTQAAAGSSVGDFDLDGGPTHLTSPAFDLAGLDATVSYWRWYHISTQWDDALIVAVSNNDGASWTTVETIDNREEWTYVAWRVSDYVTPTSQVRVRFTVDDSPNNSLVEALVDDFQVWTLECVPDTLPGDVNGDGAVDNFDISPFVYAVTHTEGEFVDLYPAGCYWCADVNVDGAVDNFDISVFVGLLGG
ncbi:MAG: C1 family peptidase [Phycisphaerae bacterium]|jgi:hypothetical protein